MPDIYIHCSDNNRANTVKDHFVGAIQKHGIPSHLRCDMGGENVCLALEWRGVEKNSVLVGPSVHNQHIKRLWRDLFDSVMQLYYRLFYYLESCSILGPLNIIHLFFLHYVYLPRINQSLNTFTEGWNNHPLSTCNAMSPLMLYTKGMISLYC